MLRTQIYLPEDLMTDLRCLATVEDISVSEVIRKNLKKSLKISEKKLDPMKYFVGKGRAGVRTNAVKEINSYYQKIR